MPIGEINDALSKRSKRSVESWNYFINVGIFLMATASKSILAIKIPKQLEDFKKISTTILLEIQNEKY